MSDVHANDPELRELAHQLVEAAAPDAEEGTEDTDARLGMLIDAYRAAVERRREELRAEIQGLDLDEAIVTLDASAALGVDVNSELAEHIPPERLVALLRTLAQEAPNGETRLWARRTLRERGIPLDEDGKQ